jgi:hypothetical protein
MVQVVDLLASIARNGSSTNEPFLVLEKGGAITSIKSNLACISITYHGTRIIINFICLKEDYYV